MARMDRLYGAGFADLAGILQGLDDAEQTVFLVGHNPGLTDLVNSICNAFLDNLPTCGVFCADFEISSWQEIGRHRGRCAFMDFPKHPPA